MKQASDRSNILFLTLSSMENVEARGIYTDLVRELANKGINVFVVCPREKRDKLNTELYTNNNINILKVRTGNITKTSFIEKGISTLRIEGQYLRAVKKYFKDIRFDMVMYSTPPITFGKIVKHFKERHKSITYLVLKDIFPQNAVDIHVMKKGSMIWRYFRNKEIKLYEVSDIIGSMSKGNVEYILKHNPHIYKEKLEVFPNSILPIARVDRTYTSKELLGKYNIPQNSTVFIYGCNLGRPQGIDFLLEVINGFPEIDNAYLLIVGSGTEYARVNKHIENVRPSNVRLLNLLPKYEYDQLLDIADIGLIFLDKRFTIPNFPSRLTAYMEYSLPILAATDKNTDLKDVLLEAECGFWSESGDLPTFINHARKLSDDRNLRESMGLNGRRYLEENYDIRKTVDIIIKHL
jgi:glycosyltransferase involved in cell wall biosynthesis